jgi:hypothetical protein
MGKNNAQNTASGSRVNSRTRTRVSWIRGRSANERRPLAERRECSHSSREVTASERHEDISSVAECVLSSVNGTS